MPTPTDISFDILTALRPAVPHESVIIRGRTGLPILVIAETLVGGERVGPTKIFYNKEPKQFRIVNDAVPKYEHRCGDAQGVLNEIGILYDSDPGVAPESLLSLS